MATFHAHPRTQTPTRDYNSTTLIQSSPTLTNPDMILPYREHHSSPTPLASLPIYETTHSSSPSRQHVPRLPPSNPPAQVGVARSFAVPLRIKPPAPTTISYPPHNYEHGAPLSVIGEEETTPKSRRTKSRSPSPGADSSPTNVTLSVQRRARRLSGQSDSSLGSDVAKWEDFQAPSTSNARLKADLANEGDDVTDLDGLDSKRSSGITSADDDMKRAERILANAKKRLTKMEDNLTKARTSILISPRSSPIMGEHQPAGGLYRSISLGGDRKLSQGGHLRRSKPLYPVIKSVTSGHSRVLSETSIPSSSIRLSRVPEIRSASALDYSPGHSIGSMLQDGSPTARSQGLSPASISSRSFNTPLKALQEEDATPSSSSTNKTSPEISMPCGLGITTNPGFIDDTKSIGGGNPLVNENGLERSLSQASTRSARDLRDQMMGLKSKVIDLKARAQADSLRRRSLQNVRAPSPYDQAAEQWYAGAAEYKAGESPLSTNAGLGWSPQQREQTPEFVIPTSPREDSTTLGMEPNGTPVTSPGPTRTDINTPNLQQDLNKTQPVRDGEDSPGQPSHYEDAFEESSSDPEDGVAASEEEQIYLNEALEESLQEAEPEFSSLSEEVVDLNGEPERHEDRVDAFDYENMFLHSALGNYSQPAFHRRNGSSNSEDSETSNVSIETARAAAPEDLEEDEKDTQGSMNEERLQRHNQGQPEEGDYETLSNGDLPTPMAPRAPWVHSRSNSMDSVSSTATFATATEGGGDSESGSDTIPKEILNWGNRPSTLNSFGGFPTPPSSSTILGMQSRAARKGGSHLVNSISQSGPEASSPNRSREFSGELPTPPEISPKDTKHQYHVKGPQNSHPVQRPADTEILMTSLITLADPSFRHRPVDSPNGVSTDMFANVDKDLVLALLRSVGTVCSNILTTDRRGEVYESRVWRRRLDAARRVLLGEFEVEEDEKGWSKY